MSRSYRKPYYGNCEGAKDWKKEANRMIRRDKEMDLIDGNHYKKHMGNMKRVDSKPSTLLEWIEAICQKTRY